MTLLGKFLSQSPAEFTAMKLGLDRVQRFLDRAGHPERAFPSVLVGGTNGKGSVVRIMESVLAAAAFPVGAYTSPHLDRFTERIRVGGQEVSEGELEEVLENFRERGCLSDEGMILADEPLTWFEQATVLAFEIFRRRKVPLALLEVGLGGRLDATNVVDPLASAIVSIGRDHCQVLGRSLFEIAKEKAGVMRADRPVVLGEMPAEVREFLAQAAYLTGARLVLANRLAGNPENFSYGPYPGMRLGLAGAHQMRNLEVALELLEILAARGFPVTEAQLRRGLAQARNPGRLESFPDHPPILLDGAHNPEALEALMAHVKGHDPETAVTIVLGMMADKDPLAALRILSQLKARFILTEVESPRTFRLSQWRDLFRSLGWSGEFFAPAPAALDRARGLTPPEGLILVTGSLHLVGEIRALLKKSSG